MKRTTCNVIRTTLHEKLESVFLPPADKAQLPWAPHALNLLQTTAIFDC